MDGDARDALQRRVFDVHNMADELERVYLETDGEVTDEAVLIEQVMGDQGTAAIEALCLYLEEIDGRRELGKKRMAQLKDLSDRLEKRERWAETAIHIVMSKLGLRRVEAGVYDVSRVSGKPMALPVEGGGTTPEEYETTTVTTKPDKRKILDALNAGKEVSGWMLGRTAESLRIR